MEPTHLLTMRAYCLVDRWPKPLQRLGKRESSNLSPAFLEIGARRRERQSIHFVPLSTSTGLQTVALVLVFDLTASLTAPLSAYSLVESCACNGASVFFR